MIIIFLIALGWPLAPMDSTHPLGNNYGQYWKSFGNPAILHSGIDPIADTIGLPVYAVQSGVVKLWLTSGGRRYWGLATADYETTDSVEGWMYWHIDSSRYHKEIGDPVVEGELIGYLVDWSVTGFDHVHFGRVKDSGAVWQYPDMAVIANPLDFITPYDDTTKPVFQNAYAGTEKFAFCHNNTSDYLGSDNLTGNVDIIAKIYDETGLPLPNAMWERLAPYKIEYEIHGQQNLPLTLSYIFNGFLDWENPDIINLIYKRDATCNTRGDYSNRDFYFIITNTDGDSLLEATDIAYSWVTTDFPDGDYWVVVTAYDAAENYEKDSMLVTVTNEGIEEQGSSAISPYFKITPNPNRGCFSVDVSDEIEIFDASGRFIISGRGEFNNLAPGIYFVIYEKNNRVLRQKVVVVGK